MTKIRRITSDPRFFILQIFLEVVCVVALIGVFAWVYTQSQTQHSICQLVEYAGVQNQTSIDTNSDLVRHDMELGTKAAKADAEIRRDAIARATDAQALINRINC